MYFRNTSACGAVLDVDVNRSSRNLAPSPVENIVFEQQPAPGRYDVIVHAYNSRASGNRGIPYRVRVVIAGVSEIIEGVLHPPYEPTVIKSFVSP